MDANEFASRCLCLHYLLDWVQYQFRFELYRITWVEEIVASIPSDDGQPGRQVVWANTKISLSRHHGNTPIDFAWTN